MNGIKIERLIKSIEEIKIFLYKNTNFDLDTFDLPDINFVVDEIAATLNNLCYKENPDERLENLKQGKQLFKIYKRYEYPSHFEDYINFLQFVNNWLINLIERNMNKANTLNIAIIEKLLENLLLDAYVESYEVNWSELIIYFKFTKNRLFENYQLPNKLRLRFEYPYDDNFEENYYKKSKDSFQISKITEVTISNSKIISVNFANGYIKFKFDDGIIFDSKFLNTEWKLNEVDKLNKFNYYVPNWSIYINRSKYKIKTPIKNLNGELYL